MRKLTVVLACVLGVALLGASTASQAQNNYSTTAVAIANLVFYSTSDTVYPQYAGVVEVFPATPITWVSGGSCATTAVAIRPGDNALIAGVQTALATGRPIQLFVDNGQTVDGVVCYLRAIEF